jgi:hypothetical protein
MRKRTEEYRQEATVGSILIPLLGALLSALGKAEALAQLADLVATDLKHCTLQLWMPDAATEDRIYVGGRDHGLELCDLPLTGTGEELLKTIRKACDETKDFDTLSSVATGYWPILLVACRHYRLPVPPQFWIHMIGAPDGAMAQSPSSHSLPGRLYPEAPLAMVKSPEL